MTITKNTRGLKGSVDYIDTLELRELRAKAERLDKAIEMIQLSREMYGKLSEQNAQEAWCYDTCYDILRVLEGDKHEGS